jgi:hypothetical protein
MRILEATGIQTLFVEEPYRGYSAEQVQLRPWDTHLSKIGHQAVADRLFETLLRHPDAVMLEVTPAVP